MPTLLYIIIMNVFKINDTCSNLISLTETYVSYKYIFCTTHNGCAEKEYFQISDIYECIR